MDVGVRLHETASLQVAVPMAVPEHMRDGMRELLSVYTPQADRRKGYATALLAKTCEEADESRTVLILTATVPHLVQFYRKFGFVALPSVDGAPTVMARQPRVSQATVTNAVRKLSLAGSISRALH